MRWFHVSAPRSVPYDCMHVRTAVVGNTATNYPTSHAVLLFVVLLVCSRYGLLLAIVAVV